MDSTQSLRRAKYRNSVPASQDNIDLLGTEFLYHSPMELNRWIIEARGRAHMTQQQLADALGVTKSNVSAWENSRHEPGWSQMLKIREVTGAPLPVDDAGATQAGASWPFAFPRSRLDQLSEKQLAELERIVVSALELASTGSRQTGGTFATSGSTAADPADIKHATGGRRTAGHERTGTTE